ncbi:MAG: Calx-beta domain-containing protein [Limisphaerales bacterium]
MHHALIRRVPRSLFRNLLLAVGLCGSGAIADTHRFETFFYPEDWDVRVTVEGKGAKALEEGMADGTWSVLYQVPDSVEISVTASYLGTLPEDVRLEFVGLKLNSGADATWTVDGANATTTVVLKPEEQSINKIISLNGSIKVTTSNPLIQPGASFLGTIHLCRPLSVGAGISGGLLAISASRITPYIATNGPSPRVDYRSEPYPDVGVRVEAVDGVEVEDSFWMTTGTGGYARTVVTAPTSSEVDAGGFVHGTIRLKAVKDGTKVEREQTLNLPFALVTSANGASLVGHEGALVEPTRIFSGALLKPGNVVQVGSEVATDRMHLQVRFCNGQGALLQSEYYSGVRATVDQGGSFANPRSVLKVSLQNLASDVASDPRRYGRMIVYKAIGNAVDGLMGIPDPVGWTVTTPGGAVEQWMTEFTEGAYRRSPNPVQGLAVPEDGTAPSATAPWAAAEIGFFSDGTVRMFNSGASARIRGPAGDRVIPRNGMLLANVAVPGGALSEVGHQAARGTPPQVTVTPEDGALNLSRTPTLTVGFGSTLEDPIQPGSLVCRLDGRLISPRMAMSATDASYAVPLSEALAPGPHVVEVELRTVAGAAGTVRSTFTVGTALRAPTGLLGAAGRTNVVVFWSPDSAWLAPGGFRVFRSADGTVFHPMNGSQSLRQTCFVDPEPLATGYYAVAAVDEQGQDGPRSSPLRIRFPGNPAATPPEVKGLSWESRPEGVNVQFEDPTPTFALWKLERATAAAGPYVDLVAGESLSVPSWLDRTVQPDTDYWYRVTARTADGVMGIPAVIGPVKWNRTRLPVTGLTASLGQDSRIRLRWDPYPVGPIAGYSVYRAAGEGWALAGKVGPETTEFDEADLSGGDAYQWKTAVTFGDGSESPASVVVSARWQPLPAGAGTVQFGGESFRGAEGSLAAVKIVRDGGTAGPAFVTYSSFWTSGTASIDLDYEPGAGTLVFNSGETEKTIYVKLLPDAQHEWPEEYVTVEIRSVAGGPTLGTPASTRVYIAESERLRWATTWNSVTEGPGAAAVIEVVRDSAGDNTVTVEYYFDAENSTATPGDDFTGALEGTLTFGPGETRKSFSLIIMDDTQKEGTQPETARFRLRNPTGGASIDTTDPFALTAVLEIRDNDVQPGQVEFAIRELHLIEGTSANLVLDRVGGSDGELMVFMTQRGGALAQGSDWVTRPEPLVFHDGQTQLVAEIVALPDSLAEGRESAMLATFTHGPGQFGPKTTSSLLLTVTDPDGGTSDFPTWAGDRLADAPVSDRTAEADADRDGVPNWREFIDGTNPVQPDIAPAPMLRFLEFGGLEVALSVCDDPGFVVTAEFASDLTWREVEVDAGMCGPVQNGRREMVFRDYTPGLPTRFVRLRYQWFGSEP